MSKVKVNLVPEEEQELQKAKEARQPKSRKRNWKKFIASTVIIILILLAVFSSSVVFSDESLIKNISELNFLQKMGRLITGTNKELKGEFDDRINLLMIGIGGSTHESGNLADTIIMASLKPSTNQASMMSIPRDLSISTEDYGQVKINAIHAYADAKDGTGGEKMVHALENLLETDIHYYAVVDFNGFERIIDEFDGVDVNVERDLIDYEYPIRGKESVYPIENRYETLVIKEGMQHMDGELALKYARSRHALGIEGSDFSRSERQQKILVALKDKVFSFKTLISPRKLGSLMDAYNEHIKTDMETWEILKLAQMGKEIETKNVINQSLTNGETGLLYADKINGAYVLLPDDGDFTEIKNLWKYIFYKEIPETEVVTDITPTPEEEPEEVVEETVEETKNYVLEAAKIEIQNGTWTTGLAGQARDELEDKQFIISAATNANSHEYAETVIYDLSDGENPATASELESIYNTTITTNVPDHIDTSADFVIILGSK